LRINPAAPDTPIMLDQPPNSLDLNSLGIAKAPRDTRVVVAMSGGVDSSVVAAMLAEEGYDVVGVTLQLYDHGAALAKKGACCAGRDIHDARRVAETIGFPHYVLDYENTFREAVIEEFADAYLSGATPVPCIRCNERVKFKDLLATARDLDADCMATGHYIQRKVGIAGPELHQAADAARDQSYFLFSTTPEQLNYLRFPLGHLQSKAETRALAARYGLPVADKPDSQDICFVPNGDYAAVIEKLRPGAAEPGDIVDQAGNVLGRHRGVIHYTVGQRKGLGIGGLGDPLYVVRLDPDLRHVIVGPKAALSTRTIPVREINWLGDVPFDRRPEWHMGVKVRSTRAPRSAILRPLSPTTAQVELIAPEDGISAGQACVFYDEGSSRIFGGGWIWKGR
jgi:tRNA-uridine 2-sulfurtransferase